MATAYKFGGTRGQFVKSINERIAEAQARGDTEEVARLNRAAGTESALISSSPVGLFDLGVAGYNWATGNNVKTGTERIMEGLDSPTQATGDQYSTEYNAPGWIAAGLAVGSLVKSGMKALNAWRKTSRAKALINKLPEAEKNVFEKYMLTGQGSDDPAVNEVINRLQKNPQFAEFFHVLDKAATEDAIKSVSAGPLSKDQARRGLITGMQDTVDGLKKARTEAGDKAFQRAFGYTGDAPIVSMDNTLSKIREMKAQFSHVDTPASRQALSFLDDLEQQIVPNMTVPGSQGSSTVRQAVTDVSRQPGVKVGPLGEPIHTMETVTNTVPGANINIPGSASYTTTGGQRAFSAQKLQGWLSNFGKKAANGDSLVNGLTSSDEQRISAAIFDGLQQDLKNGMTNATDKNARVGLRFLDKARKEVKQASDAYNDYIAQGLPAYLKDKSLAQISYEDMHKAYTTATPEQRIVFREALKNTQPESLQHLDASIAQDFFRSAFNERKANGLPGIDLSKMSSNWVKMTEGEKQMYAQAMGVPVAEFEGRMKDALLFSRKMQVGSPSTPAGFLETVSNDTGRVAGMSSYGLKQGVDIATDAIRKLSRGMTDEQIFKALLNKDAAQTLKEARLTPNAAEMLVKLTKVKEYPTTLPMSVLVGQTAGGMQNAVTGGIQQPAQPQQPDVMMPPEMGQQQTGEVLLPPELQ